MNIESATPSTTTLKPPDVLTINITQVSQCPRSPMVYSGYVTSGYQPQYWSKRARREKKGNQGRVEFQFDHVEAKKSEPCLIITTELFFEPLV